MKKEIKLKKNPILIILRYLILLGIVFNPAFIYKILTPLTIYLSKILLDLFYKIIAFGPQIMINGERIIEITPACVAGSAYLLLLILNLFVAMNIRQRIYSLILSMSLLLILNVLRIFFLSVLLVNNFEFFYLTHKFFWYALSTIFVIIIWFFTIKMLSIKKIPVVSDIKYFIQNIKP